MSRIAILNTTAPYGTANGQEALDMILAAGSFGQDVAVIFVDDGVFQLTAQQQPDAINAKNYSKTFSALPFYDVEDIYVGQQSLAARNLSASDLVIEVTVFDEATLSGLLSGFQHLVRF